jgi:hypothetical protein
MLFFNISNIHAKTIVVSGSGEFDDVTLEDVSGSGSMDIENSAFNTLIVSGSLDFTNIKIKEILTVTGSASGKGLECKRLIVSGSLTGENIIVTGDAVLSGGFEVTNAKMQGHTNISGGLEAKHSEFHEIEMDSNEITLIDTMVHNIIIKASSKYDTQKIILKGKTIISGDIIFESGKGQIVADKQVVIKGKIEGAKLHKK